MELAIDTSTNLASVALSHCGEITSELTWHSEQNHTVDLLPNIIHMLHQAQVNLQSLNAIFIAKGPGSFNGLRVGISTAKGLAFALHIPLIGISTLEVEAYSFAYTKLPLCPIHNAGRGEIATALYQQNDNWNCLVAEHITTIDTLCQQLKDETLFCGEIMPSVAQELRLKLDKKAIIPEPAARLRHASYLVALGWQRLNRGDRDNPATLQPLYLRQPPITQRKVK